MPAAAEWTGAKAVGTTAAGQDGTSLARLSNGQTVVAWATTELGTQQIKVQRYDDAGAPVGGAFRIDAPSEPPTFAGSSQAASVTTTPTGYVVSWCAFKDPRGGVPGFPEPGWDAFLRRFDSDGAPVGTTIQVNVDHASACPLASVAALADGRLGVAYTSWVFQHAPGFNPGHCLVRTFDSAGAGSAVTSVGEADSCKATALPDGYAVVLDRSHYVGAKGVFLRHFDATGAQLGEEAFIDGTPRTTALPGYSNAADPDVAALPGGNLALAWTTNGSVVARTFTPAGVGVGSPFQVAPQGVRPRIASLSDGTLAVAWGAEANGAASTTAIWLQRFEASGAARGQAVRVTASANIYGPRGFDLVPSSSGHSIAGWKEPAPSGGFSVSIGRY